MWKIKFKQQLYTQLQFFLFNDKTTENGCFLKVISKGSIMFVTGIIEPLKDDWNIKDEGSFVPNSKYILYAINQAEDAETSLAFVHTHPLANHPNTFSYIDIESNKLLFENISPILNQPIASLVFKSNSIHGVVYHNEEQHSIDSYHVVGNQYRKTLDVESLGEDVDTEMYDRQIRFIGENNQELLNNLKISVVGAGGIGSPLVYQLAKIGVKSINVFDGDKIDKTNLPRIYGDDKSYIGRYKVDVLKEFVGNINQATINTFPIFLEEPHPELIDSDIIIGGLDNHTARNLLNNVSIEYAIPYIDAACAIPVSEDGDVEQALTQISVVTEGEACLWCMKILDANKIREENLSKEEKKDLIKDGYYSGLDKAPSVIFQTSIAASQAISRLFNILGIFDDKYPNKTIYELNTSYLKNFNIERDEKCPFHNSPFNNKKL